ncbi:hypothetical protein HN51_006971 [Arachis hypogaea]
MMMMMKGQCMPRMKNNNKSQRPTTPISLLERFREAVLRLMMVSALSRRGANHHHNHRSPRPNNYDSHQSEAVADCIEFIKKKAANHDDEDNRHSNESSFNSCNT